MTPFPCAAAAAELSERYARLAGLFPTTREGSPDFRFVVGERRPRHPGSRSVYTVLGYAFDGRGAPRYVLLDAEGHLVHRSARRANAIYGPGVGVDPRLTRSDPGASGWELRVDPARRVGPLTLYPILGATEGSARPLVPLLDALEHGQAVVHETGTVAELAVDVLGGTPVLGLVGELLRGGRQDRTVRLPVVLQAGAQRAPLPTACVEAGRWAEREGDSVASFRSGSRVAPASLRARLASGASQSDVWEHVACTQESLGRRRGASVRDTRSATSMVLSLDDPVVARQAAEIAQAAAEALADPEVVGLVAAVEGELHLAEWFATPALFRAYAPRLLESVAMEALARPDEPGAAPVAAPPREFVRDWLATSARGDETGEERSVGCRWIRRAGPYGTVVREVRSDEGCALHVQVAVVRA